MANEHVESDALGDVAVADDVYYGVQTIRAQQNFRISGDPLPSGLIHALGIIKAAAARSNASLGLLPNELANAIAQAADEVADGRHDAQFVVDVFQTGSGTSSHMNANEVIAKRANELLTGKRQLKAPVHPNDHVNLGQSSNDVFPTAIHLAALLAIDRGLLPAVEQLRRALADKAAEFDDIIKIGRTHLQDAMPVRLGQEFAGFARMVERGIERLGDVRPALEEVALGATAVGTGFGADPRFVGMVLQTINDRLKVNLRSAANGFEALGSRHALVWTSGALKVIAVDLMKIANDLRLMSSGPRCGLGEITLPGLQPGSSMMPGKINPVIPEAVCQVAAQVIGNDAAVTIGGQSGLLELNVMMPMMANNVLKSIDLLTNACQALAQQSVAGIEARRERCRELVDRSLALTTALVPKLGYDRAAQVAAQAAQQGRTIREVALEVSGLTEDEVDELLDADSMTRPARSKK